MCKIKNLLTIQLCQQSVFVRPASAENSPSVFNFPLCRRVPGTISELFAVPKKQFAYPTFLLRHGAFLKIKEFCSEGQKQNIKINNYE